jgi:DNA-binding LacI/PurR family transcriptional regulator
LVTIADIAASAGVSVPTVSKVLNGRPGVSQATRVRVEALIEQFGYAKSPVKGSDAVELVFPDLSGVRAVEVIRGVQQVARRYRCAVVISEAGGTDGGVGVLADVVGRRPRAVVAVSRLSGPQRELLTGHRIAFVVLDPVEELPDEVPFVGATDFRGGQAATGHLVGLGHRRIALLAGPDGLPDQARLAGYHSVLHAAGVPADPGLVVPAGPTREDGYAAAAALLAGRDRPTAIIASSDLQAMGVYRAARQAGLTIPKDLSVIGVDDLPTAAWVDPPLTTVHRPLADMAATATELALTLATDTPPAPAQTSVEIATALTTRESTTPPPTTH